MPLEYADHGLHVAYPDNWTVETSETEDGFCVLLQSPGTAFMQLLGQGRLPGEAPAAACDALLAGTLATLREDYPELETQPASERIAGRRAVGEDGQFISLDLTVSCWLRVVSLPEHTLLVLCQTSDLEYERAEPVLRAMRASIRVGGS